MISNVPIVLLTEEFGTQCIKLLTAEGFSIKHLGEIEEEELTNVVAIFTKVSIELKASFFKQFTNLKYVVTPSTGTDTIKLSNEEKNRVTLITLRDDQTTLNSFFSTREVFLWLLISLLRNTYVGAKMIEDGIWDRNLHLGENIFGKKLGILGFGRIGKHIADVAISMGMTIKAFDINPLALESMKNQQNQSIDEFLNDLDVLSINIDDRPSNVAFLNSILISKLPTRGTYVINTARGSLIDEDAVISGLEQGRILGYGADVLANEGSSLDWLQKNKLWIKMKIGQHNIVMTPHLGGATKENIAKAEQSVVSTFLKRYHSDDC